MRFLMMIKHAEVPQPAKPPKPLMDAMAIAHQFMELHRVHWPEFECESDVRPIAEF